jgi:LacI family transcriptional regulator
MGSGGKLAKPQVERAVPFRVEAARDEPTAPVRMTPPTVVDVARRAGVSTATVSRILSGASRGRPLTRERVIAAARELGYRPSGVARSLKLRSTRTIGLIITDIANPFYPELVRAIEDAALERHQALLLCNGAEDAAREAAYLEVLAERRVEGIIVASSGLTERHGRWLARAPLPVVLVNCTLPDVGIPGIQTDNVAGARLATEHLLDLGHRSIAHVAGPPTNAASAERRAGFAEALAARGLDPDGAVVVTGDGHVGGGERALLEILARAPETTGIVAYNDLTAIGVLRALRRAGRSVPQDVSVVGFDDIAVAAEIEPPLTTVTQDVATMGRWAVEQLTAALAGNRPAGGPILLAATLQVRESTGPPPARRLRASKADAQPVPCDERLGEEQS